MKLSHRDQLLVIVVVVVLLAVAAVFLLILPQRKELARLSGEIRQAEAEITEARGLLSRRQEAKKEAVGTEAELLKLGNAVPESPELPSLIIELQDAANDSGLDFRRIAPDTSLVEQEGYGVAAVKLKMSGRWADFVHFFQKLQKLNRQLRIVDIIVTPKGTAKEGDAAQDDEQVLEANVTIEVYTMGKTAAEPAVPSAPTATQ
ncbi:MAG: type 4a pilus biogenesis protein PilO [Coriobacteriia bacterium]|nr:type 4a pilus biogenesis protein PilO [Coriobacteriia bacterium]